MKRWEAVKALIQGRKVECRREVKVSREYYLLVRSDGYIFKCYHSDELNRAGWDLRFNQETDSFFTWNLVHLREVVS